MTDHADRRAIEAVLIALRVADTWTEDHETAVLAASTISPAELASGLVSLYRTLAGHVANLCGITRAEVADEIRRVAMRELDGAA